jgi:hypothetical protein
MFPIEDGSQPPFNVYEADVDELAADTEWLSRYHESLQLVSAAWGWDLERGGFCLCLCSLFRLFPFVSSLSGVSGPVCSLTPRGRGIDWVALSYGYDDGRGHATAACVRACVRGCLRR